MLYFFGLKGMFNSEVREYLQRAMKSDLVILVCCKGGDGNTTLILKDQQKMEELIDLTNYNLKN